MIKHDIPYEHIEQIMEEINYDINLLFVVPCCYSRNLILNHLRERVIYLETVIKNDTDYRIIKPWANQQEVCPAMETFAPMQVTNQVSQFFTQQELSIYDGKNGNPSYVAVNGSVYDVTDNAAWAAATHFGLRAGKDLTDEFASCHASQTILNKLKVVGKLV